MDWQHFNVHWEAQNGHKGKTCITALSKEDAKATAENYMKADTANGFPFEGKVLKVVGPLGVHPRTEKQKQATQYRTCIGAIAMAQFNVQHISGQINDAKQIHKIRMLQAAALKSLLNAKRDVADIFKIYGLKIK